MKKLILLVIMGLGSMVVTCNATEPAVIANKEIPVITLNHTELIKIFTKRKLFWPDGHRIAVFIKPIDSIEHKIFTISTLNISPFRYKTLAEDVVYSGINNPPEELNSDEEMLLKLARTPYSIGYINYSVIVNIEEEGLKKIKVEE